MLDRLVHGRLWIPVLGFALIGIVFMQVSMLKLNAGIGQNVARSAVLERENASLRTELSRLGVGPKVQNAAVADGMVVPAEGRYRVLNVGDGAARRAAAVMTSPAEPVKWGSTIPAALQAPTVAGPAAAQTSPTVATPQPQTAAPVSHSAQSTAAASPVTSAPATQVTQAGPATQAPPTGGTGGISPGAASAGAQG